MTQNDLPPPIPPKVRNLSAFAELMRQERKRLGLTQAEAAQVLGVNLKTLENWECDRVKALAVTQEGALARYYGWDLNKRC